MALPHLPGNEIHFGENRFSILLGFRLIQDLGIYYIFLNYNIVILIIYEYNLCSKKL